MVVNDSIISMTNSAITCKTERFYHQFTGDEVLSVNGTAFQGFTHKEALDTFKVILEWNILLFSLNLENFEKFSKVCDETSLNQSWLVTQNIVGAPVAQRVDNTCSNIQWINQFLVDECYQNKPQYSLDSDLSRG